MKFPKLMLLAPVVALLINGTVGALEPRELTWGDLVSPEAEFNDPFTKLEEWQLLELSEVARIRDRIAEGRYVSETWLVEHEERIAKLEDSDVDIDYLISIREDVANERIAKTHMANPELDGKTVKIPGYLLPLEYDGDKVTEFFLVPYVGACIHTPPPEPNQIVHVMAAKGYASSGGLYAPIWVTGTMKSEKKISNLDFVDGATDIPSSYALDAITVEPYE